MLLRPGTLCMTVGGTGVNAGRIVVVIRYTGRHPQDGTVTEGYLVRTASGRPFAAIKHWSPGTYSIVRNVFSETIADRRNLRPLAEELSSEEAPREHCRVVGRGFRCG